MTNCTQTSLVVPLVLENEMETILTSLVVPLVLEKEMETNLAYL